VGLAHEYWLATAVGNVTTQFCTAMDESSFGIATAALGVAPAFCVYGGK
jgi:hypothetical protein